MPPKQAGRPRKSDTEGTPQQIKRREYQRKYQSQIKAGIEALEKDEEDCLKDLEKMRKEKSRLIDELEKAKPLPAWMNVQAQIGDLEARLGGAWEKIHLLEHHIGMIEKDRDELVAHVKKITKGDTDG